MYLVIFLCLNITSLIISNWKVSVPVFLCYIVLLIIKKTAFKINVCLWLYYYVCVSKGCLGEGHACFRILILSLIVCLPISGVALDEIIGPLWVTLS